MTNIVLARIAALKSVIKQGADKSPASRVPAAEVEGAVVDQIRGFLRTPEVVVATWRAARPEIEGLAETEVREALHRLDQLWEELFPAEQARIIQLLVERVDVGRHGLKIRLRVNGLTSLTQDLAGIGAGKRRAA